MGNRVYKASSVAGNRRYIVDIASGLPVILMEIDDSNGSITNKYYYANAQILRQANSAGSYFYIHDRLGSIRLVINDAADVNNSYTYSPFGEMFASECNETVYNPFKFTGQWYDSEIGQYYLRARMYDPVLMRFTGRDPVRGKFQNPLTLHLYLYCLNDPINRIDPSGLYAGYDDAAFALAGAVCGLISQVISDAIVGEWSGWEAYTGSIAGGALGGWATLYVGPWGGGAISGGAQTLITQGLESLGRYGNLSGINSLDVLVNAGIGGITGGIPGPAINGITASRGSFAAVTHMMVTNFQKGLANRMTSKTFGKIFMYNMVEWSVATAVEGMMEGQ
jgi:RHS repeat-associated protein